MYIIKLCKAFMIPLSEIHEPSGTA